MACFFAAFSVSFSFLISYFLGVMIPAEMRSRKFSEGTNGYSPVSYTHLDVYKRQQFNNQKKYSTPSKKSKADATLRFTGHPLTDGPVRFRK